ncbi:hypothetical protein AB9K34_24035 [Sedimentitalea sp. XS_ASV28]
MNVIRDFIPTKAVVESAEERLSAYDWDTFADEMNGFGCATLKGVLRSQ